MKEGTENAEAELLLDIRKLLAHALGAADDRLAALEQLLVAVLVERLARAPGQPGADPLQVDVARRYQVLELHLQPLPEQPHHVLPALLVGLRVGVVDVDWDQHSDLVEPGLLAAGLVSLS